MAGARFWLTSAPMLRFLRRLFGAFVDQVGRPRRGKILLAGLVSSGLMAFAGPARAEEPSILRVGISGGLGALFSPGHGSVPTPSGQSQDFFAGGIGLDLRLGAQIGPYVAIDAQVLGETFLLGGDMRAGALVEIAPVAPLAFALGGGVGTMFTAITSGLPADAPSRTSSRRPRDPRRSREERDERPPLRTPRSPAAR